MIKEIRKRFTGAINTDDSNKDIPKDDYRDLLNLRSGISSGAYEGLLESIQSTLLKTVIGGPSASTSIRIGGAVDKENDKVYLLYHEPGVADFVISLDIYTEGTFIIFKDPIGAYGVMNLDPAYPVYNARVLNNKLFWTDNNEEPRYLKIDKAIQYMANKFDVVDEYSGEWILNKQYTTGEVVGHNGYFWTAIQDNSYNEPESDSEYWDKKSLILDSYKPQLLMEDILFIATPPIDPSTYTYITDVLRKANNLRGNLYQFAYRWIYDDFRKSVFGPVSGITLPQGEEMPDGEPNEDASVNNRIDVSYNSGGSGVVYIEIIFRSSKDASTWYRVVVVNKYDDNNHQTLRDYQDRAYSFFDDVVPYAVSDTEVYKPFHYVPQKAGFLEVIEDNHIIFGNCREGYPDVRLNVDVEKNIIGGTADPIIITMAVEIVDWELTPDPPHPRQEEGHYMIILPEIGYTGSMYKIVEYSNGYQTVKTASYVMLVGDEAGYPNSVRDALVTECGVQGIDVDTCYSYITIDGIICFNRRIVEAGQIRNFYETIGYKVEGQVLDPEDLIAKYINLKAGAIHGLGIVYLDDRRRQNPVSVTKEMGVYLDFYNDDRGSGDLEHDEHWEIKLIINHIPPPFATHYHIVYTGNLSMSYWIHARISTIEFQTDYIEININAWIDAVKDAYRNFDVDRYIFQSGDRFRVIGYIDSGLAMYGRYIDVEVIGTDPEDSDILRIQRYLDDTDLTTNHVIEIYRPKRTTTANLYFEIAQKYPIIITGDGPVHGGDVDQTINSYGENLTGAEVTVIANDSYKYRRELLDVTPFYCESAHLSDYMRPSDLICLGFPKIEDELAQQVQMKNRMRFGGILSIGTKNNQIADFEYDDYEDLPEKHGGIYGLQEVGFVLKVIQAHKLWSIYIKRTSSFNPDGSENIILTDAILGTKRPSIQDWGTQNPESVLVHEKHLYFLDRSTAKFIRDSANGPFPISSYKTKTYFRNIIALAKGETDFKCIVGVNEDFEEIFVHWYWAESHQAGIVFNEVKKRWTHRTDEMVDAYINFGSILIATNSEKIYIHNRGIDYGEYNGVKGSEQIVYVVNGDPDKEKIWKAMSMKSKYKYFNELDSAVQVPADPNYPSGMETRFPESLMEAKEGIYYAPIMKDTLTPHAGWTVDQKAVGGREMRGQVLIMTLKRSSDGEFSWLEGVRVRYVDSETS